MGPFHWSDPQTRVALTMADDDITNNMLLSLKKTDNWRTVPLFGSCQILSFFSALLEIPMT